jgi:transketolase
VATAISPTEQQSLDQLCINTVRTLAMDAVQKAESGHPGTPMALAPLAYVLWTRHLRHNPADPGWPDRDRFVLSAGHASMLLYSLLYLSGYDLELEDLKQFRQWESRTPGHPEYSYTPGVETTTGPLGQGVGNAVGLRGGGGAPRGDVQPRGARARRPSHVLHRRRRRPDGRDLARGRVVRRPHAARQAHRLLRRQQDHDRRQHRPHVQRRRGKRFEAYGWHVLHVADVNDLDDVDRAIAEAKAVTDRPSLIVCRTVIGYGSPNRAGTAKAHGEALGADEIKLTKANSAGRGRSRSTCPRRRWPSGAGRASAARPCRASGSSGATRTPPPSPRSRRVRPPVAPRAARGLGGRDPTFTKENGAVASRAASGIVLNAIAAKVPELIGGSADLAPSNNTMLKGPAAFDAEHPEGRNFHFGIREHGMGSIMNGMALHGGIIPYGGTFLVFADYMKPAIRLAAFMERHVIYVFTHDSIGLGEDGPTHQPIEQLTMLRSIPGMTVVRPADANETAEAWRRRAHAHARPRGARAHAARSSASSTARRTARPTWRAARTCWPTPDGGAPDVVLMSSGSEVALVVEARTRLAEQGVRARVVERAVARAVRRAGRGLPRRRAPARRAARGHRGRAPDAVVPVGGRRRRRARIERFGASAPYARVYEELGITVDKLVDAAKRVAGRA